MKKGCLTSFILVCSAYANAQTVVTDYLLKLVSLLKEDTNNMNLLLNLTGVLRFNDLGKEIVYGLKGRWLSKKLQAENF